MERSADSGVPPSQGRCPARVHFHIALAGICVPLVGLVTAIILALKDRARNGQDGEHRRWTRRLFGLIIVDLLVFASLVVFGMHQEETVQALSNPVARLESGPRIGVTFDPASQDPRVLTVVPDMPAARAGLRPGDRITSIDGVDTRTYPEVQETILRGTAGVMRRIGVSRGDERLDVVVVPVIPRELRLMDTVAEKRAIPWHHGLVWVLCACVMAGIARIIAKRRGAPRIVIWRVIILSLVGAMGTSWGVMVAAKAIMGGWSIFGLILGLYGQMLALLLIIGASLRRLGPAPAPVDPGHPNLSRVRVTLLGFFYLFTGFVRVAVLLAVFNSLVLKSEPPPGAIEALVRMRLGAAGTLMLTAVVVFIGPIAEELMFRGFLLPRLAAHIGRTWALWGSATLFASLHFKYGIFVVLILYGGLVLGWARLRSGGLTSPVILHMAINGTTMAILFS